MITNWPPAAVKSRREIGLKGRLFFFLRLLRTISCRMSLEYEMGIFKGSQDPEKLAKKEAAKEELRAMASSIKGKAKAEFSRQLDDVKNPGSGICEGVSKRKLYAAILKSGADLKYSIVHSEASSGVVVFQTHDAEKFWDGNLSCSVYEVEGGSEFRINGRAEQGMSKSGKLPTAATFLVPFPLATTSLTQAASEGGVLKHQSKLKKKIFQNVELVPEPEPDSQEAKSNSVGSLSNELSRLNDLFNAGVLTQQDFDQAKSKLLS